MFNIMIVEDDRNTQKLMKAILTHEGYDVFVPKMALKH